MTDIAINPEAEALVNDARMEKVFYGLQRLVEYPAGLSMVATIQEPTDRTPERHAVFMVISPHPKKNKRALTDPNIITVTAMTFTRWQEMNFQHRHYAGLSDPLRPVMAGVLRRHMQQIKNLEELND